MPRRKKKGREPPPLAFVRSPVEQRLPCNYDDGCLENAHPIPVRAVSVDNMESVPWVSPQFRSRPATRAKAKSFTKLRSRSEGSATDCFHPDVKTKFPQLQFVRRLPPSSFSKTGRKDSISSNRRVTISSKGSSEKSKLRDFRNRWNDSSGRNSEEVIGEEHREQEHGTTTRSNRLVIQGNRDVLSGLDKIDADTTGQVPGPAIENVAGSAAEAGDAGCENCGLNILVGRFDAEGHHVARGNSCPLCDKSNNIEASEKQGFCTPPSGSAQVRILAADTPESDYGLSMRQRQLKKYFTRSKSKDVLDKR